MEIMFQIMKQCVCNILNEYFGSVFTEESDVEQLLGVENRFSEDSNHML
jgi:hypothetical protein